MRELFTLKKFWDWFLSHARNLLNGGGVSFLNFCNLELFYSGNWRWLPLNRSFVIKVMKLWSCQLNVIYAVDKKALEYCWTWTIIFQNLCILSENFSKYFLYYFLLFQNLLSSTSIDIAVHRLFHHFISPSASGSLIQTLDHRITSSLFIHKATTAGQSLYGLFEIFSILVPTATGFKHSDLW